MQSGDGEFLQVCGQMRRVVVAVGRGDSHLRNRSPFHPSDSAHDASVLRLYCWDQREMRSAVAELCGKMSCTELQLTIPPRCICAIECCVSGHIFIQSF